MMKKLILLIAIISTATINTTLASILDTSYTEGITAFDWAPISDVDKIMQHEKQEDLTKRSVQQAALAADLYREGVNLMKNKDFSAALTQFKAAMKRYKRAKLSADAMNFINVNMALSYTNSGNKEDLAAGERLLNLITPKIYNDNNWTYNVAMAHYFTGSPEGISTATSLLSSIIRKDKFYFQAYVTLEGIYRNSGNEDDADKVNTRMHTAEEKLHNKNQKLAEKKDKKKAEKENRKGKFIIKGERPDITNLIIIQNDDHLQFNKKDKISERSMIQIQEGISDYNLGVKALADRDYKTAQKPLKDAEKRLKRGKVSEDGLNFSRANLSIAYLATGERRGIGQAKRYLKKLTPKLYKTREWTYNIAVAKYAFAAESKGKTKEDFIQQSIKLFQKSIKQDKLFLPAYENLIYIYREQGEGKKAESTGNALQEASQELMQSFSREEQLAQGFNAYIFRLNLGTFGSFDTPADLFDEANVIAVPVSEKETTYLSGLFYNLDEAINYQNRMNRKGYLNAFIVGYKDGKEVTDF